MLHTITEINTFLSNPLPSNVLQSLLNAVEAFGSLKVVYSEGSVAPVDELLLIRELQYISTLSGKDISYEDIIAGISLKEKDSDAFLQAAIYRHCERYLQEALSLYKIIPATDFLRVNCCLSTSNLLALSDSDFTDVHGGMSSEINEVVFKALYGLNNDHHIFIRFAATYYLLSTLMPTHSFYILALDLLFSLILCNDRLMPQAPIWLAKYIILDSDWDSDNHKSFEKAALAFTEHLTDEFSHISLMIKRHKSRSAEIVETIKGIVTGIYADMLSGLISSNLCFRNGDVIKALDVTPMTAIKYIKALESNHIVTGIKLGREKIYIVNGYSSLIVQE